MAPFPPPQLPPNDPVAEPPGSRTNRRVLGAVAALGAAVAVGGVVIGSQFVSADRPSISSTSAAALQDDPAPAEPEDGTTEDGAVDDKPFGEMLDDLLPPELTAEFEAFEQCLDEQFGGVFGELGTAEWNGSVVVENFGGDAEDTFSMYDFGEGDATVTVTKSGDTITVETSGDVTAFEATDFEAEEAEFDAAEQACADLLPEDVNVLGDQVEVWLGEGGFPFDEGLFGDIGEVFETGEFPLDDRALADIKEMFETGEFGEFSLDDQALADIKEMFETGEFGAFPIDDFEHDLDGSGEEPADGDQDPATSDDTD